MPKSQVLQSSLTTGVISPTLHGRVDIAKYYNALDIGNNITLMPHGGAKRRAGSVPILKSTDSSLGYEAQELYFTNKVKSEPFVFNIDQKYLIVFDYAYVHIIKDKLLIHSIEVEQQNLSSWSFAWSDAFGTNMKAFSAKQLEEMDVTQYGDTMIIVHPDFAPIKLVRGVTETDWTFEPIIFKNIPLYDYENNYLGKKEIFEGDGTATEFILIYTIPNFTVYIGSEKILEQVAWTALPVEDRPERYYTYDREVGKIVFNIAPENGTTIELISGAGVPEMDADHTYEDIWSVTRGYPKTVTIFQGRLYFGGTKSKPVTVFGSVINDYFDFNLGDGAADMGIFDTIASGTFDDISVITSARTLQAFTESGEYFNPANPVTPTTSAWKRQTGYGAARSSTVSIDGATYFIDRSRAAIRQFIYSLEEDAYVSPNISLLSDNLVYDVARIAITKGTGSEIANLVYVLNGDGSMAVLNTMRLENIQGWSRWTTQGLYSDVCAVDDDLYTLVARGYTDADEIKYYIEMVDDTVLLDHYHTQGEGIDIFRGDSVTKEFNLVNSTDGTFEVLLDGELASPQPTYNVFYNSITFSVAPDDDVEIQVIPTAENTDDMILPTSAAKGFRELSKKGNFFYEGEAVPVEDGGKLLLSFDDNHTFMEAGFNYQVKVRTVNLNKDTTAGQIINKTKRLVRVKLNVYETLGITVENYIISDRKFIMSFSKQLKPFTGIKEVYLLGYAKHNAIEITQDIPMPFTLLQIEAEIKY